MTLGYCHASCSAPFHADPTDVTPAWLGRYWVADVRDVDVTPIGTGQTGATYRVSATYADEQTDLPGTFAIKLPAQDDTVRERVALGYRSEVEFYTDVADQVRIPVPALLLQRHHRRRGGFRAGARRYGARGAGRSDRGLHAQEARLAVEALAGLHGPSWCDPAWLGLVGHLDAETGRRGRGEGPRRRLEDGRRHHDRQARRTDERRGPGNSHRRNGLGDTVAAGRAEAVRTDARRLSAGQHAVRSRPHPHHGGRLADDGRRPACQGSGLLHRDQPGARGAIGDRARPRRPVPPGAIGLRRNGLRRRHLLARLPPRRRAGAVDHRTRASRSPRPPNAATR